MDRPEITSQEVQYIINTLQTRPLAEALPLWLKLTRQRIVSNEQAIGGVSDVTPLKKVGE